MPPWNKIRGFNYQPSYGSSGLELWLQFDAKIIRHELSLGKRYFPAFNAVRWWLSWEAFQRCPARMAVQFETALTIAAEIGLQIMPVLFNRWHDACMDYGGIYLDHFLPIGTWVQSDNMFMPFLESIVGAHANDPRICAWDLCNEPFTYFKASDEIVQAEYRWLESIYHTCKRLKAQAPLTIGTHQLNDYMIGIRRIEPISDILSIHPYWVPSATNDTSSRDRFARMLDDYGRFAEQARKPLVATETCWGSLDDAQRASIIRFTLQQLRDRQIGWFSYLLHHSMIPDAHRPEFGPVSGPGNLAFIEADGRLRSGHEVWNEFAV